jgi:hypothetical protein
MTRIACSGTYPIDARPHEVPAFVRESADGRSAVVWHPSGDIGHENVRLTVARLKARRMAVVVTTEAA